MFDARCKDRLSLGAALKPARPILRAGDYLIGEEIARGGFGVVYRAAHAITGRPAAVKVLHEGIAGDAIANARFDREADVLRSIAHPHVCEIFEHALLDDGRPFIAMELLTGATLATHLATRVRLRVEEVMEILDALAAALEAVHEKGIVHRDIKPSNVFLAEGRPKGRVVLLDFGVAKLRGADVMALTGSQDAVGTLLYMAPEQIFGSNVDARTDVYALGALAYVMLTGQPPFGASAGRLLRQIHKGARPKRPSEVAPIPPALDAPILRALDPDAFARHPSPAAFVTAFRAAARASGSHDPREDRRPAHARRAFVVYADMRAASSSSGEESVDAWLEDMESALPIVAAETSSHGLVAVVETATKLLLVEANPHDPSSAPKLLAAVERAYRRVLSGLAPESPVRLGIVVHEGDIYTSPEGTLIPEGLLDLASWVPAAPAGVIASQAPIEGLGLDAEPVSGAPGFFWILR